jgi:hypothetical protein
MPGIVRNTPLETMGVTTPDWTGVVNLGVRNALVTVPGTVRNTPLETLLVASPDWNTGVVSLGVRRLGVTKRGVTMPEVKA